MQELNFESPSPLKKRQRQEETRLGAPDFDGSMSPQKRKMIDTFKQKLIKHQINYKINKDIID